MGYTPTSSNPFITTHMLNHALYTVKIIDGPAYCEELIKQRYDFRLVLDYTRKKLLAVSGVNNDDILIDINLVDIISIVCLDASQIKEHRHRIQVVTKNAETFIFYVSVPYQWDPLPFISDVQQQINYAKNPHTEVRDNKAITIISLIASIIFAVSAILDWVDGGNIGWGFIALFISAACGIASYSGFCDWGK